MGERGVERLKEAEVDVQRNNKELVIVLVLLWRYRRRRRELERLCARRRAYSNPRVLHERIGLANTANSRLCQELFGMSQLCLQGTVDYLNLESEYPSCSRVITGVQQLAIFLDWAREAHSFRGCAKALGLAPETARRYVRKVADRLKGQAGDMISFPERPMEVYADTPKFRPLRGAAGAIDGSHVKVSAALFSDAPLELERWRSRKGALSTNVIAISSIGRSLQFLGFYPGAEGRANDARLFNALREKLIRKLPRGGYLLGDAGFPLVHHLVLTPYRGVRYHLKEWSASAEQRPSTPEELFNLRHAQLRNAVERIFGVWKRRFKILNAPPEWRVASDWFSVIGALAVLHNIIRHVDGDSVAEKELTEEVTRELEWRRMTAVFADDGGGRAVEDEDEGEEQEEERDGDMTPERRAAVEWRNGIRDELWRDYLAELARRGLQVAAADVNVTRIAATVQTDR